MDPSLLMVKLEEPDGDLEDLLQRHDTPPKFPSSKAGRKEVQRNQAAISCLLCGRRRRSTYQIHSKAHKEVWTRGTSRTLCALLDIDHGDYEWIFQEGSLCQSCFTLSSDIHFAMKMRDSIQARLKVMESTLNQLIINHYGSPAKSGSNSTPLHVSSLFSLVAKKLKVKTKITEPEEILPTRHKRNYNKGLVKSEMELEQESECDEGGQGLTDSDPDFIVVDKWECDSDIDKEVRHPKRPKEIDDDEESQPKKKKKSKVTPKLPCPVSDCPQLFTTPLNVKVHVHSCHEGSSTPYYCEFPECSAKFRTHQHLLTHTNSHRNEQGKFPCPIPDCPNLYPRISWLCDHIKSTFSGGHGGCQVPLAVPQPLQCQFCGKLFDTDDREGLNGHESLHDPVTPFKCVMTPCHEVFRTDEEFKSHVEEAHEDFIRVPEEPPKKKRIWKTKKPPVPKLPCPESNCDLLFTTPLKVKVHVLSFHQGEEEPYHCDYPYCAAKFRSHDLLVPHSGTHKDIKGEFPCPVDGCPMTYSRIAWVLDHMHMKHAGLDRAQCQVCGKRFLRSDTEDTLKCHEELHERGVPFSCVMSPCAQSFGNRGELRRHVEVEHEDVGVFCDLCPRDSRRSYSNQRAVDRHIAWCHGDPSERKCTWEGCGVIVKSKKNLRAHLRLHDEKLRQTHMCEECGATYGKKSSLNRHKFMTHTNERPHKCLYCDRTFNQSSNLLKHEEVHLDQNQKNHLCSDCGKSFRLKQSLWQHATFYCPQRADKDRRPSESRKRMDNVPRQRSSGRSVGKTNAKSRRSGEPRAVAQSETSAASPQYWTTPGPVQVAGHHGQGHSSSLASVFPSFTLF